MKKKTTLKKELATLMILASACTLLSACAAVLYVFFSFFVGNTQEDIQYVLNHTSQQFQNHIQFIEDGAVAIRHNTTLDGFFQTGEGGGTYDKEAMEPQLSYSMEVFSDRNVVERRLPFVTSVYLFNNADDCIYEHYYASTLSAATEQEARYRSLQQEFKESPAQYQCTVDEECINLLFRIYDDQMWEKGICIAVISREAVQAVLSEAEGYSGSAWCVMSGEGQAVASFGEPMEMEELSGAKKVWSGLRSLSGRRVIGCGQAYGFGLCTAICVGQENIFSVLKPTMLVFAAGLLAVLAIAVFVAFGVSDRFTRPVTRMIESIRAFGKQDFDARIEDSSIQEFHDIGMVFNEMADRITYLIQQVYEKQLLAAQAQMKYLQAQINPHFQFNILAMLSLRAKMAGNEDVYEGLRAFSKLIQGKIFRDKEVEIQVREELEIVRFYLYLQKSRYQDKLSYEIEVEGAQIERDLIPRLLIEPLVENAVSHGLEPKLGDGSIKVRLYERMEIPDWRVRAEDPGPQEQALLHICVEDDGVGFDTGRIAQDSADAGFWDEKSGHTHTGLENTKRMLKILYGDEHAFRISGGKGKGTKIEIILLAKRGGDDVEDHSGG